MDLRDELRDCDLRVLGELARREGLTGAALLRYLLRAYAKRRGTSWKAVTTETRASSKAPEEGPGEDRPRARPARSSAGHSGGA